MSTQPVAIQYAYLTFSGQIAKLALGTDPLTPVYPQAIVTVPTIAVNGVAVTVQALVSSNHGYLPYIDFILPAPVKPSDVVTWDAPAGWVAGALASSGMFEEYIGETEPPMFNYPPFGPPTSADTMLLGFNVAWPQVSANSTYSVLKNLIHRTRNPWYGALTSTPDGYPLTIATGGASAELWDTTGINNGIDAQTLPTPTGTYTAIGPESNPATPMIPSITSRSVPPATISAPVVTTLEEVNGVQLKQWVWTIERGLAPWNLRLFVNLATPGNVTGPNSLNHLYLCGPGNAPDLSGDEMAIDESLVSLLTNDDGSCPAIIRGIDSTMGFDGTSSASRRTDLASLKQFSYAADPTASASDWPRSNMGFSGTRYIPVVSVRPYTLANSPNVLMPFGPAFTPTTPNWFDLSGNTQWFTFEVTSSVPHNLSTGQTVSFPGGLPQTTWFPFANPKGASAQLANFSGFSGPVFVTGPYTFVMASWGGGLTPSTLGFATATVPLSTQVRVVPRGNACMPPEALYSLSKRLDNCKVQIEVPHAASDDYVHALATRALKVHEPGREILVQWSNEALIPGSPQAFFVQALSGLSGLSKFAVAAQRTSQVAGIFRQVFREYANDIKTVYQVFMASGYGTTNVNGLPCAVDTLAMLQWAQAAGQPVDYIMGAPYWGVDNSPSFKAAAASVPVSVWHDIVRHGARYNSQLNGPGGFFALHTNAIAQSGYAVGPLPQFGCYEAAISEAYPSGISTDNTLRGKLSADFWYHPRMAQTEQAYLQALQCPGPVGTPGAAITSIYALCMPRQGDSSPDGNGSVLWPRITWGDQRLGPGLGNLMAMTDGKCHDDVNASVAGWADMQWVKATQ